MEKERDIFSEIFDACVGEDISNCENILKQFSVVKFVDEKIDDMLDDGIYLMMRSYNVGELYVRLYYGSDDYVVADVEII